MKKSLFLVGLITIFALSNTAGEETSSLDFSFLAEGTATLDEFYISGNAALDYTQGPLSLFADASALGDGQFAPTADGGYFSSFYFTFDNIGAAWDAGFLKAEVGRLAHYDVVESPYSLFISSEALSALVADITVEDEHLFYSTRWVGLPSEPEPDWVDDSGLYAPAYDGNGDSDGAGWIPDRGANYKVFGLKFDGLRVGLLDASVYNQRSFDLAYFVLPFPSFFIQYVSRPKGEPDQVWYNDNAFIGLFADYSDGDLYAYTQLLVDDIALNRYFNPEGQMLPDKLAWSLGGELETRVGAFRFYHAGATKYTFAAVGPDQNYEYTYYRIPEYNDGSGYLPLEDNYIGYKYGENNISFQAGYSNLFLEGDPLEFSFDAMLEYVVSGSKAPNNPWHEGLSAPPDTELLNESVLEHRLGGSVSMMKRVGLFDFYFDLTLTQFWNRLAPTFQSSPDAYNNEAIYRPQSGLNEMEFSCTIGGRIYWDFF